MHEAVSYLRNDPAEVGIARLLFWRQTMQNSPLVQKIADIITPTVEDMGYKLVRIKWREAGSNSTLQIMVERQNRMEITVDDCSDISHTVSALLDIEDPISGAYNLEVSSPGIDRPLVTQRDFMDYVGHLVKIEMQLPIAGRKRFRGIIKSVSADGVVILDVDSQDWKLDIAAMADAKLVLTDKLLEQASNKNSKIYSKEEALQ